MKIIITTPFANKLYCFEEYAKSIGTTPTESAGIQGDATNDRASLQYVAADTSNHTMTYQFTYQVL